MTQPLRRTVVALLLAAVAATAQAHDPAAGDAGERRLALNREAEAALSRGDPDAALERLELAAAMAHSADTELLMVRAWLQRGEFRRALGFCAHTVAAHRDSPAAAALYRQLLRSSGQNDLADRVPVAGGSTAGDVAGPVATWRSPRPAAMLVGRATALLLGDGRHALTASRAAAGEPSLWLRNGLGETVRAEVVRVDANAGLALLRLEAALKPPPAATWLEREPFGGSAGYVIGFEPGLDVPAWPRLHAGFHAPVPSRGPRRLGIAVPAGLDAAPVFDASGQFAGLALGDAAGEPRLITTAVLREWLGPGLDRTAERAGIAASRIGSDAIYERSLTATLQVLAATGP